MSKVITIAILGVMAMTGTAFAGGDAAAGKALYATCAACHGPDGMGMQPSNSPKLAGLEEWYLVRQLQNFKKGVRGQAAADAFGKLMAPMVATLANDEAVANVSAYIAAFPDKPAAATVEGDTAKGKQLYVTCAACHGPAGEGNEATNAPRLKGMSDWYLVTQLKNFKSGARGTHADDVYGKQMAPMAMTLGDEQAIKDVIAYINSL